MGISADMSPSNGGADPDARPALLALVAELGQATLAAGERAPLLTLAVARLTAVLDLDYCAVSEFSADEDAPRSPLALGREDAGLLSSLSVPIPGRERPFGLLIAASRVAGRFGAAESSALHAVTYLLAAALTRLDDEAQLRAGAEDRRQLDADLAARRQAEADLRASVERFAKAFQASPTAMSISRLADGVYVDVNQSFLDMVGFTRDEVVGHSSVELNIWVQQGNRAEYARLLREDGFIPQYETPIRHQDGQLRDTISSAVLITLEGAPYIIANILDITHRKQAEQEHLARLAAEQASLAKSEFLSRMSHELRTPLNAILGFAQLMEMSDPSPDQRENLDYIIKGGRHLLDLINEVLDIARIEEGRTNLSIEPVRVVEVLDEAVMLTRQLAIQAGLTLDLRVAVPPDCEVLADWQRLKQVLLNLLSNALKYNRPAGSVTVACTRADRDTIRVAVSDTGWGIPLDKLARLFTPFDRLGAEASPVEGTGLGLALSQRLMEAMGGKIQVRTTNTGTTFWFDLRIAERSGEYDLAAPPEDLPALPRAAKTVLYAEDNSANLILVQRIMERWPHVRLLDARQGSLALDLIRAEHPDLVLLDLHLPDMNGGEILGRLQADPATRNIPVVILSAAAAPADQARLLAGHARAYLTKPLDVREFIRVVGDLLTAE